MKAYELLQRLGSTTLSNLPVVENDAIKEEAIPQIVEYINDGLQRLYEKFDLKSGNVTVETIENRAEYELTPDHALSNMPELTPPDAQRYNFYIYDVGVPFEGDIMQIRDIYDSMGHKLPLNDRFNEQSIFTTRPNTLLIPYVHRNQMLNVSYLALPPKIKADFLDQEIDLPAHLTEALCDYVAYGMCMNINTEEAIQNAMKYKQAYDLVVQQAIETDSINHDRKMDNLKFFLGGWI